MFFENFFSINFMIPGISKRILLKKEDRVHIIVGTVQEKTCSPGEAG